jgi:hypothetical protein
MLQDCPMASYSLVGKPVFRNVAKTPYRLNIALRTANSNVTAEMPAVEWPCLERFTFFDFIHELAWLQVEN